MHHVSSPSSRAVLDPPELATLLAERLERWALVRTKVLSQLDFEGARSAEELAGQARMLCTSLLLAESTQRTALVSRLHQLIERASVLIGEPPIPGAPVLLPPAEHEEIRQSGNRPTEKAKLTTNRIFAKKTSR